MNLLTRVVLIIAAALLPPLLMQVFNEAALRAARRDEVRAEAMRDARTVGAEIDAIIAGVRNALVATAAIPAVRAADAAACEPLLQSVFTGLTLLHELALVGDDGRIVCASDPQRDGVQVGAAPEVRLAQARGGLALGGYRPGATGGHPVLPAAYPVRGLAGPGPVLVGAIDLDALRRRLAARLHSADAAVTLADRGGTVLVALPDAAAIGRPVAAALRTALDGAGPTVTLDTDARGASQMVATLPPGEAAADILVSVAVGTAPAYAAADAASARGYALIGGGFIVAVALAAWMARGTIARPVHAILATTERWQRGDTAARLPSPDHRSEFGRIAEAVNALLDAVAAGQAGLHERLAEIKAIYDGSPVGLGYIARDLRYVTVNARLAEINATPAEQHRGRTVRELLPTVADRIEPLLVRAMTGEPIPPEEVAAATEAEPGVLRRLLVSYQPAVAQCGSVLGVVVAVQEVTALRRAEAALRAALERANAELEQRVAERTRQFEAEVRGREAAQAQLQQAQKMEVIGQLTGGVAHDFNNLLTAIIGNLELASARSRDRPDVTRLLTGAMRSADRGAALTQRMLAFGRRQFLCLQPVAIPALLDGMSELLARTIDPSVALRIEAPPALRPARADPNQVELVVLNLVLNARDAMPGGGQVAIAAAEEHVPAGAVHPAGLVPGDYVRISVTDSGAGMDSATQARAFEPFFTTKPVGRGSGLGLSMVQGVAAQSDGGVALKSTPGEGTTVSVWLPCAETVQPAAAPPPRPGLRAVARGAGRSVLLVDDDADVAAFASVCLEEAGYAVHHVLGGAEALELLTRRPPPDLLIADLGMPGMNGLQLAAAARRLYPGLTILIATGYAAQEADDRGSHDLPVLSKPFKAADLLGRVAELLAEARPGGAPSRATVPDLPRSLAGTG